MGEFFFSADEVEGEVVNATAPLETIVGLLLICDEAVQTGSQEGLEAGLTYVVAGEVVFFKRVSEKTLGEILCVFIVGLPFNANVLIDRLPIAGQDGVECATTHLLVLTASSHYCRLIGQWKTVLGTPNVCVSLHYRAQNYHTKHALKKSSGSLAALQLIPDAVLFTPNDQTDERKPAQILPGHLSAVVRRRTTFRRTRRLWRMLVYVLASLS